MDIFLILSVVYLFSIVSLTAIVFLWLLGASKARREARRVSQFPHHPVSHFESDVPIQHLLPQSHLIPRRLSFSAATPASAQQPRTPTPRRVTFNLTPEQQRAELAKSHTPPQPPPNQPSVSNRRAIKAPLLELFDSSTSRTSTKTTPSIASHTPLRTISPTHPTYPSHRTQGTDGPNLSNLLNLVKGEGEEIRKESRAIDEKLVQMEGQNSVIEENRPFGFVPTMATHSFGLVARQRVGLKAFGGELGRAGKRRAVH